MSIDPSKERALATMADSGFAKTVPVDTKNTHPPDSPVGLPGKYLLTLMKLIDEERYRNPYPTEQSEAIDNHKRNISNTLIRTMDSLGLYDDNHYYSDEFLDHDEETQGLRLKEVLGLSDGHQRATLLGALQPIIDKLAIPGFTLQSAEDEDDVHFPYRLEFVVTGPTIRSERDACRAMDESLAAIEQNLSNPPKS